MGAGRGAARGGPGRVPRGAPGLPTPRARARVRVWGGPGRLGGLGWRRMCPLGRKVVRRRRDGRAAAPPAGAQERQRPPCRGGGPGRARWGFQVSPPTAAATPWGSWDGLMARLLGFVCSVVCVAVFLCRLRMARCARPVPRPGPTATTTTTTTTVTTTIAIAITPRRRRQRPGSRSRGTGDPLCCVWCELWVSVDGEGGPITLILSVFLSFYPPSR